MSNHIIPVEEREIMHLIVAEHLPQGQRVEFAKGLVGTVYQVHPAQDPNEVMVIYRANGTHHTRHYPKEAWVQVVKN